MGEKEKGSVFADNPAWQFFVSGLDAMGRMRYEVQRSVLKQWQKSVQEDDIPGKEWIEPGLEVVGNLLDSQREFEQAFLTNIKSFSDPLGKRDEIEVVRESKDAEPDVSPPPIKHHGIELTIPPGEGEVEIPITINNHLDQIQEISLEAVPFQEVDGVHILIDRISFDSPNLSLPPQTKEKVLAFITIGEEFEIGKDYLSEIRINGQEPKSLPVKLMVREQ